jgi:hypothetical protein
LLDNVPAPILLHGLKSKGRCDFYLKDTVNFSTKYSKDPIAFYAIIFYSTMPLARAKFNPLNLKQ